MNKKLPSGNCSTGIHRRRRKQRLAAGAASGVCALLACALASMVHGQRASPYQIKPSAALERPNVTLVDTNTWEVISPDGDQQKVAALNTPEMKQARQRAHFDIMNPGPSADKTAKTPEEKKSIYAILHPIDPAVWFASQTPAQQAEIRKALHGIQPPTARK